MSSESTKSPTAGTGADSSTPAERWSRLQRLGLYRPELGFWLDLSCLRADEQGLGLVPGPMADALGRALGHMAALEAGAEANPDEKRRVGHYWLRAPGLAPEAETRAAIEAALAAVKGLAARVHGGELRPERAASFTRVLVVGIGGSALGPQLVADALGSEADRLRAHFIDNTDPDGIDRLLAEIGDEIRSTLTVVISKSGGTKETRNGMLEVRARYERAGLTFGKHAVAITKAGSQLAGYAAAEGFLAELPMWDWVGGRTSVTSAVGLVPAALQGLDIDGLLEGARRMDEATRSTRIAENPAALLAAAWHHVGRGRGHKAMVVMPYKDRLVLFSRYLQQLVMESLGKRFDLAGNVVEQGIVVYGNKGSTDQHAYVQQLLDGLDNAFVTFIEVLTDRSPGRASLEVEPGITSGDFLSGFLQGTRRALRDRGRDSVTLTVERVDARSLGALIALFERAVGLYAALVNVNAYHQPGVEAGKRAAAEVLELQGRLLAELRAHADRDYRVEELAAAVGTPDCETVFFLLRRLARNPGRGVAVREPEADRGWGARYRAR